MPQNNRRNDSRFLYACDVKAFPHTPHVIHDNDTFDGIETRLLDIAIHGARFQIISLGTHPMPQVGDKLVLRSSCIRDDKVFDNMLCEVRWVENNEFGVRFAMTVDRSDIELLLLLVGSSPDHKN